MDNLISFYNTLFGIEVTIFGIISATILVFIQLVYSKFPYKYILTVVKNKYIISFFVICVIDVIITLIGNYFLIFPSINLILFQLVSHPIFAFFCIFLMLLSFSFFIVFIIKNIEFLHPSKAVNILLKNISYKQIRNFIWKKYEIDIPYQIRYKSDVIDLDNSIIITIKDDDDNEELNKLKKKIEKIKKKTKNSEDPFLPIQDMMIQSIKQMELSLLYETGELLVNKSIDFIENIPNDKNKKWSENSVLNENYTNRIIDLLTTLIEIAEIEKANSAKKIILDIGYKYSINAFNNELFVEAREIYKFFQEIAFSSIDNSENIFEVIVLYYQNIGENIFDSFEKQPLKNIDDSRNWLLDEIIFDLYYIGETILNSFPFKPNTQITNEYSVFLNCLLRFSDNYNYKQPSFYPVKFFDVLMMILRKLTEKYIQEKNNEFNQDIYRIAMEFSSFANRAILVRNANGCYLSVMRIKQAYEETKHAGLYQEANRIIKLLIEIGIEVSNHELLISPISCLDETLDIWITNFLVESGEDIKSEVMSCYLHTALVNHDAVWKFITNLGKRMNTNFGFMFDPITGETYPDDDPRPK